MAEQTDRINTRPHGAPRGFAIAWVREAGSLDPARAVAAMAGCAGARAVTGLVEVSGAGGRFHARQFFGSRPAHPSRGAGDAGIIVLGDCRLTRTSELARALGVPEASGDVDLVVAAYRKWGEEVGSRLDGDYAIAIWDELRSRLVLLRDPFAMRPLYWSIHAGAVLVASETRMLHAAGVPARVDEERLAIHLCGPYGRVAHTFWQGVGGVEPGETHVRDERSQRSFAHWRPSAGRPWLTTRLPEAVEGLEQVLRASTRDRIDPGATGLALSGGVDSTCVALASERGSLRAFSYAFERVTGCDERDRSATIAVHAGAPVTAVPADDLWPYSRVRDGVPALYDGPINGIFGELAEAQFRHARAADCHTVLVCNRGDELIGTGVWDFPGLIFSGRFGQFRRDMATLAHSASLTRQLRIAYQMLILSPIHWRYGPRAAERWRRPLFRRKTGPAVHVYLPVERRTLAVVDAISWRFATPLPDGCSTGALAHRWRQIVSPACRRLSEVYERQATRAGVEFSDPWADRRIAEFILRLPPWIVEGPGRDKALGRAYIAKHGPVYDGPYVDFVPVGIWREAFLGEGAEFIDDLATARELEARSLFDGAELMREVECQRHETRGRFDPTMALDAEYWLRTVAPATGAP